MIRKKYRIMLLNILVVRNIRLNKILPLFILLFRNLIRKKHIVYLLYMIIYDNLMTQLIKKTKKYLIV